MNDALSLQGLPQGTVMPDEYSPMMSLAPSKLTSFLAASRAVWARPAESSITTLRGFPRTSPFALTCSSASSMPPLVLADGRARSGQRQHRAEDDLIGLGERGSRG